MNGKCQLEGMQGLATQCAIVFLHVFVFWLGWGLTEATVHAVCKSFH